MGGWDAVDYGTWRATQRQIKLEMVSFDLSQGPPYCYAFGLSEDAPI